MKINKFLFGVGVGTVIGLLLAPKKGSELRDDIKDKSKKIYFSARELTKEDINEIFNQSIDQIKSSIKNFDANELKDTTIEKMEILSGKLEELKDKIVESDQFAYFVDTFETCTVLVQDKVDDILLKLNGDEESFDDDMDLDEKIAQTTTEVEELIRELNEDEADI